VIKQKQSFKWGAWQDIYTIQHSYLPLKPSIMGNLLYIIAVILIIGWLLGKFAFGVTGNLIHILLVIAIIVFLIKLLGGSRRI
jgi:ABC-type transport system involved in cytochrome bd biosynthesis fused ATPase/permease subunit